jgi:hypothetical protein
MLGVVMTEREWVEESTGNWAEILLQLDGVVAHADHGQGRIVLRYGLSDGAFYTFFPSIRDGRPIRAQPAFLQSEFDQLKQGIGIVPITVPKGIRPAPTCTKRALFAQTSETRMQADSGQWRTVKLTHFEQHTPDQDPSPAAADRRKAHGFAMKNAVKHERAHNLKTKFARSNFKDLKKQLNGLDIIPQNDVNAEIRRGTQTANKRPLAQAAVQFRDEWTKLCSLRVGLRLAGYDKKAAQNWLSLSARKMEELDQYVNRAFGGFRALKDPVVIMPNRSPKGWAGDVIRRWRAGYKTELSFPLSTT